MSKVRIALGIRAQLLLVLTVFLAIPWLGYEYVRELERFLRDAQEKTLAGTAQAVATALHDRPRLFDAPSAPRESLVVERSQEAQAADPIAATSAPPADSAGGIGGSAEGASRVLVYAQVKSIDAPKNRLTVELQDGTERTYDPRRQQGVSVFREEMRSFSVGDRIQFTKTDEVLRAQGLDGLEKSERALAELRERGIGV